MTAFVIFAGSILVLIGVHEMGHFFAAKAFGVSVIEFAIGFGPTVLSRKRKATRYSLRAIPFGGYVRMAGEDRREPEGTIPPDRFLYNKRPYVRAIISLSGPAMNLILALVVILGVMWASHQPVLQIAGVVPDTPAAESLVPGDRVLAMNGRRVFTLDQITAVIQASSGEPIEIDLIRDGEETTLQLRPAYAQDEDRFVLGAYFLPIAFTNQLTAPQPSSQLEAAGLQEGDFILAVDDTEVGTAVELLAALEEAVPAEPATLTVLRGDDRFSVRFENPQALADELTAHVPFLDLGIDYHRPGFIDGLVLGTSQFAGYTQLMGEVIRGIVTGQVTAGEVLQGPVGVARTLEEGFRLGWAVFFQLLAFLSLNFGLLNLVPFPGLDGSRAGFALYESLRGRPIPPEREGLIHAIGFLILIGVMVLITYQDIVRIFR